MTGAAIVRWQAGDALVLDVHGVFDGASAWALRVAMEESSGIPLATHFDQWFYRAGVPLFRAAYSHDASLGITAVTLSQRQALSDMVPVFTFPMPFELVLADGTVITETRDITQQDQTFLFKTPSAPVQVW